MHRFLLPSFSLLAMAAPVALWAQASSAAAFDSLVNRELRTTRAPGAVIAIVEGDRVVDIRAYGVANAELKTPMTPELLFQVGSITKMFTAALVLSLAHDGVLDLDAPASRYVSGLSPRLAGIPVRHLISQSGGLRDVPGSSGTHEESALLAFVRSLGDTIAPLDAGRAFSYANPSLALAGAVAQEAARKPFADLMRERILEPLGMDRATFRPTDAVTWPSAVGHIAEGDKPVRVVRPVADDSRMWPAGYLYAQSGEIARFVAALSNHGVVDGRQLLARAIVDSMIVRRVAVPGMPNGLAYGYGLFLDSLRGEPSIWHAGSMPGFSSLVRILPNRRIGVVVMVNRDGLRVDRIAEEALAWRMALARAPFVSAPLAPAEKGVAMSREELLRHEGRYENRWSMELRVRDGVLVLSRFGSDFPVTPLGGGRFSVPGQGGSRPEIFTITPASGGQPAFIQMFLWSFPRRSN